MPAIQFLRRSLAGGTIAIGILSLAFTAVADKASLGVALTSNAAPLGFIEIRGVEAGAFNPRSWQSGKLNFVLDARFPLLSPRPGKFRNIYAPSAVETPGGYRLFYGAWDGIQSGNDHIYSADTDGAFQSFANRHAVISPADFQHVCNVNALRLDDGAFALFASVYPVDGQNRPGFFKSDITGTNWNGKIGEPYPVQPRDILSLTGYNYARSDINGVNVMLRENGQYRLYFGDFRSLPGVFRASSADGRQYHFDAKVFGGPGLVNDVKKFRVGEDTFYLMGLHQNGAVLWQTISTNSLAFGPAQLLFTNLGAADRYIVALGWVTKGSEDSPGRKLLGVLYGAGPVTTLDQNQIYARWLEKRVVFVTGPRHRYSATQALGPDRQLLEIPVGTSRRGHFEIYAEDGETLLVTGPEQEIKSGRTYQLVQP
jgi:hypothetical protein